MFKHFPIWMILYFGSLFYLSADPFVSGYFCGVIAVVVVQPVIEWIFEAIQDQHDDTNS